jgi:hypothetical protein
MSVHKTRLATGIAFIFTALFLVAGWCAYAAWTSPRAAGAQLVDGAALSTIPLGLALVALLWGLRLFRRSRDGDKL